MASRDSLVDQLQSELKQEAFSRRLQEELNSKLQDEYDVLLKRLAEAESHIDRLRFLPNVKFDKYFILRHHTEQHSTLRQRLEAQFDPAWRAPSRPGENAEEHTLKSTGVGTDPIACESNASSSNEDNFKNGNQTENLLDNHNNEDDNSIQRSSSDVFDEENVTEGSIEAADNYVPLSPHITKSCSKGGTTSPGRKKSPNPPTSNRELNGSHSTSDSSHTSLHSTLDSSRSVDFDNTILRNGFKGHQNAASESQELLLDSEVSNSFSHSPYPRTHPLTNSTHSRSHSSITDTGDTSLSQLSATAAENRSSAESTQLAHLFKVHSLQEELSDLKSKLNDRDIPLDTIVEGFRRILQEHQQLTMDVDVSSAHLDTIREKDGGKPMDPVTKTKRAIGNELAKLADQLQDFYSLIQGRATEEEEEANLMQEAPSSSEGLIEKKDSDSRLSNVLYDSLNSPYLPTKYLSQDTSNSNQQQLSPEGLPHLTNGTESRLPPGIAPTSHSLPQKSNSTSGTSLVECTGLHCDAEPTSVYPPRSESDRGRRERWRRSHSKKDSGALGQENGHGEGGGNAEMEQLLNLEATEQVCGDVEEQSHAGMLSDLSDISSSDEEIHLHSNEAALSAVLSDESEHSGGHSVNVMCSPDSYHLQEAKKNLKRAKDFGYSVNNSSSGAADNGGKNAQPLQGSKKSSRIPRLRHTPGSQSPSTSSPRQQPHNLSGAANKDQSHMTLPRDSHMTFPGEADSGFAGSEFPSRAATRMDTSIPGGRGRYLSDLASSALPSMDSEDDVNQQRFAEATAAIEALRKELADLKILMMRNVKQQNEKLAQHLDSTPHTPSSHSHSTVTRTPPTKARYGENSREHPSASRRLASQLSNEASSSPSLVLGTPHHSRAVGQLTTTSIQSLTSSQRALGSAQPSQPIISSMPLHSLASQLSIASGQSSQQIRGALTSTPVRSLVSSRTLVAGLPSPLNTNTPPSTPAHSIASSKSDNLSRGSSSQPTATPSRSLAASCVTLVGSQSIIRPAQSMVPSHQSIDIRQSSTSPAYSAVPSHITLESRCSSITPAQSIVPSHHSLGGRSSTSTPAPSVVPSHNSLDRRPSTTNAVQPIEPSHRSHDSRRSTSIPAESVMPSHHSHNGSAQSSLHSLGSKHSTSIPAQSLEPSHHSPRDKQLSQTNTATPSHSSSKSSSPSHFYSTQKPSHATSGTTHASATRSAQHSSMISPLRNPSSIRFSTPALSAVSSLKSTPMPTPQHTMPAHNMRTNSSTQPNSTDFGSNFANHPSGGTVSGFSSDTLIDVNSTPDHYWMNQRAQPISRRHYYAAQSGFHSMTPSSMIRRFDDRGAVDQCRLPDRHSYPGSEAGPLHIPSNVAIAGSSTTSTDSMNSHRQPTDVLSDHSPPASVVSGHCHAADVMGDHCHLTDAMSGHSEPTNAKSRNDISGHRQPTDAISQPANVVSDHRQPTDAVSDHRLLTNVVSSNVATAATSAQQGGTSSQVDQVCAHCGERDTNVPPNGKTLSDSSVTCQPTNVMSGHHQPFEIMNDPLQPTGIMSSHTQTADTMDDHYHSNVMNGHRHLTNHINDPLQRTNFTNGHRQSTNITNNHPHPASVLNGHYQPISDPLPQPTDIVNDHRPATNIMNDLLQPADSLNRGSSKPMTLDGGQTPGTFTPSRRNKVLNSRHIQARQSREEAAAREKLDRKFKFSRSSSNREFSITPAIHNGSSAEETIVDDGSSPATSHSPPRRRKRSARISTTTVLSSPTRSHRHGSDTSLGVHSSPIHRHLYSNTRRASSPGLFPNIHSRKKKRSYGQPTVDHRDAEHLAYPVHCPTESSADSEEDCHDNAAPGRNAECTCTACDDRTLLARIPSSAKRGTNIGHMPSQRLYHNHDSDPDTSPEHCSVDMQGCRHAKQRLLKVIETPKLTRKRRVVYLTSSSTPSSEEVYYSEPGQFVTPRSSNQRKRVFGVARGTSGSRQSVSRDKRSRMVRVRDAKQGKVYIEPATSTKRVYVMEQSGSDSETDLEQFDVLETCDLDLEDTLRLAHELKKRTRRLKGSLQAELDRERFH